MIRKHACLQAWEAVPRRDVGLASRIVPGTCRSGTRGPADGIAGVVVGGNVHSGAHRAQGGGIVPARFVFRCPRGRGDDAQASGTGRSDQAGFRRATARFKAARWSWWSPAAKRVRIGRQASIQREGGSLGHTGGCRDQWRGQAHGKWITSRSLAARGRARGRGRRGRGEPGRPNDPCRA